ncbi:MAG: DUF502 domain-containing protein [Cytophagales bacterium]
MKQGFISTIVSYFFRGLLFTAPIFITFYILIASFQWVDRLIPIDIPGSGIAIIFLSITLLGLFASTFLATPLLKFLDNVLDHTPLVNLIYGSIKDLVNAFVGENKKFKNPVLITIDKTLNLKRLGFITETDLSKFNQTIDMVAVYIPDSYGLTGNLYFSPKENIEIIPLSVSDVMKFIVSGGISGLKNDSK